MIQEQRLPQPDVTSWRCTECGKNFKQRDTANRHARLSHDEPVEETESVFGPLVRFTSEEQAELWRLDQPELCLLDWEAPGWYGPRPRDCVTDEEISFTYAPIADVLRQLSGLVADLGAYEASIRSLPKEPSDEV